MLPPSNREEFLARALPLWASPFLPSSVVVIRRQPPLYYTAGSQTSLQTTGQLTIQSPPASNPGDTVSNNCQKKAAKNTKWPPGLSRPLVCFFSFSPIFVLITGPVSASGAIRFSDQRVVPLALPIHFITHYLIARRVSGIKKEKGKKGKKERTALIFLCQLGNTSPGSDSAVYPGTSYRED